MADVAMCGVVYRLMWLSVQFGYYSFFTAVDRAVDKMLWLMLQFVQLWFG